MEKIKVRFPDGSERDYEEGITGTRIAESISKKLAEEALAVKLNGTVQDMESPIRADSELRILTFDDPEGKDVYWHSTSHLMAQAV